MSDLTGVTADWQRGNHWSEFRSEGYARAAMTGYSFAAQQAAYFSAPLISQITDNLWMGGCVDGVNLDSDFDTVVSLYPWGQYKISDTTQRTEIEMYDTHEGVAVNDLLTASGAVLSGLETGNVLVHCQAGLNRSGLVTAFALMRQGMSADEAIDLLREKRDRLVLCNRTFVSQLKALEAARGGVNVEW